MTDILDDLRDLQNQATTDRSHYYVKSCCDRAIYEIVYLRKELVRQGDELAREVQMRQNREHAETI